MDPDGSLTAPRMDFEVAGRNVSFEDVNKKEHRLAELSRFVDQMVPPTLSPCCSSSANATAASLAKVGARESKAEIFDVVAGGRLPRRRRNFGR